MWMCNSRPVLRVGKFSKHNNGANDARYACTSMHQLLVQKVKQVLKYLGILKPCLRRGECLRN